MPPTRRLEGLDAARGLAVVSMLVAHLCPTGGLFNVSEYLTAPLFAVIIGVSMGLVLAERRVPAWDFLRDHLQRGLFLVVLGLLLQALYGQIVVVLPYLGALVMVLAPLALLLHRRPALTIGLAAAGASVGPVVIAGARAAAGEHASTWPRWWSDVVQWLVAGGSYRVVSFLPMALAGLALARVLRHADRPRQAGAAAALLVAASSAAYLLGRSTPGGAAAYSGAAPEVVGGTLLAMAAIIASFLALGLARRLGAGPALEPLLSTGRLALTGYTLQVLFLAAVAVIRGPVRDDSWPVLVATALLVVGGCWLVERWFHTGPLEWLVRRLRPTGHRAPGSPRPTEDTTRREPGRIAGS